MFNFFTFRLFSLHLKAGGFRHPAGDTKSQAQLLFYFYFGDCGALQAKASHESLLRSPRLRFAWFVDR
jgi:hypothetical protein